MRRYVFLAGILFIFLGAMLPSVPAGAITAKEKMATCKFGADDQKLQGPARAAFLKKCMANRNDPRGSAAPEPEAAPAAPASPAAPPKPRD